MACGVVARGPRRGEGAVRMDLARGVDIGTAVEQEARDLEVAVLRRAEEGRPAVLRRGGVLGCVGERSGYRKGPRVREEAFVAQWDMSDTRAHTHALTHSRTHARTNTHIHTEHKPPRGVVGSPRHGRHGRDTDRWLGGWVGGTWARYSLVGLGEGGARDEGVHEK